MTLKNNKIAVWGLGKHALNNIIPAIDAIEDLEMYGVFSRDNDVVKKSCIHWNCKTWTNTRDLLSDPNVDIIYLSTPPGLHYEQGLAVLESGKHLWCEKPFTTELKHSEKLIDISINNNLSVCEGFMYLYHPQFIKLKEHIKEGVLGDLNSIHCSFGLPELDNPGFRFVEELGGSCLLDVGSYPVSAIISLFPDSEIIVVDSDMGILNSNTIDIDGWVHLKVDSAINCFLEWGYNRAYRNDIDIWATTGRLYSERIFSKQKDYKPNLQLRDINGNLSTVAIEQKNHFELMLQSFTELIQDQEKLNQQRNFILKLAIFLNKIKQRN